MVGGCDLQAYFKLMIACCKVHDMSNARLNCLRAPDMGSLRARHRCMQTYVGGMQPQLGVMCSLASAVAWLQAPL